MNYTLLIMAGGMGSRYGGLKQVDSFGPTNESILDYSIFDSINACFNKIVIFSSPNEMAPDESVILPFAKVKLPIVEPDAADTCLL